MVAYDAASPGPVELDDPVVQACSHGAVEEVQARNLVAEVTEAAMFD